MTRGGVWRRFLASVAGAFGIWLLSVAFVLTLLMFALNLFR